MIFDNKWEAVAGAGVEDAVFFWLDQGSQLTHTLRSLLRGDLRLFRDLSSVLSGWCNRPAVYRALRRLLPDLAEMPALPPRHYYCVRVHRWRLEMFVVRAHEGEGFTAETAPWVRRL